MKLVLTTIAIFFSVLVSAQVRDTLFLWPNQVPSENKPKHAPVQTNNTTGNVVRLTDITNPALVVFEPEKPNGSGAAVIVCPGGGYNILAIDKGGYEIAEWLNTLGYTAFVLQYRVPQKQEGAFNDIQRAIRLVRSKASKYNLNTQKIGVMGFSAGGHLSARASTGFKTDSYPKEDAIDGLSCRPNFSMLLYPAYLDRGENKSIDPQFVMDSGTPPFFIFGTADDVHGNGSLVMAKALRDKNVPLQLHILHQGGHGYGLRPGNIAAETWPSLAENWLTAMVKTNAIAKYERMLNFPKSFAYPKKTPKKEEVWVFIMAGQSNMAGRGFVEAKDTIPSERILSINKNNELILAKEPLDFYDPSKRGLDCGMSFAKNLLKSVPDNVSILLVPTAVGGSPINKWLGDSIHRDIKLASNFKEKVLWARNHGEIKGILWHQGESDANSRGIPKYDMKLAQLFKNFRKFAGDTKLPILVGELGTYSKNHESWMAINHKIKTYALRDKNTAIINTSDLKDKGDKVHFDSESLRILGKRFADAYIKYSKLTKK